MDSGTIISLAAVAAAFLGAAGAIVARLVKQRRRAQVLLVHSLEAMKDGFVLYDDRDRLMMWNTRAQGFYSPTARTLGPGTSFETIIRTEMADAHFLCETDEEEAWIQGRLAAHRSAAGVEEQYLADGRCIKIAEDRTPDGYTVSLIVDITELKRAQHAAEAADRAKTDLLSTISHELRTPLTVVLGNAAFVAEAWRLPQAEKMTAALDEAGAGPALRGPVEEFVRTVAAQGARIRTSSQHLIDLVNEILDLARLESGRLSVRPEWLPLDRVVEDAMAEFRSVAEGKGITLDHSTDPAQVYADPLRLKQILYNLLGNALKFTDDGRVSLTASEGEGGVRFAVEDTGCGIGAGDLDRIFESFHQVDASTTRRHRGSGLGLTLSRELAELHGGGITVTSEPGRGSRFECFLPAPAEVAGAA